MDKKNLELCQEDMQKIITEDYNEMRFRWKQLNDAMGLEYCNWQTTCGIIFNLIKNSKNLE